MRPGLFSAAAILSLVVLGQPAAAADCTANDFAEVVDQSGASLRALTLDAQPKIQERLRRYKAAKKLSNESSEETALDAVRDSTLDDLDKKSADLLLTVDSLGRVQDGAVPDCSKLAQVRSAAAELNKVIKAKSDYIIRRLDEKIAEAEPQAPAAKHDTVSPQPPEKPKPEQHAATAPVKRAEPAPPAAKPPVTSPWTADTKPDDAYKTPDLAMRE